MTKYFHSAVPMLKNLAVMLSIITLDSDCSTCQNQSLLLQLRCALTSLCKFSERSCDVIIYTNIAEQISALLVKDELLKNISAVFLAPVPAQSSYCIGHTRERFKLAFSKLDALEALLSSGMHNNYRQIILSDIDTLFFPSSFHKLGILCPSDITAINYISEQPRRVAIDVVIKMLNPSIEISERLWINSGFVIFSTAIIGPFLQKARIAYNLLLENQALVNGLLANHYSDEAIFSAVAPSFHYQLFDVKRDHNISMFFWTVYTDRSATFRIINPFNPPLHVHLPSIKYTKIGLLRLHALVRKTSPFCLIIWLNAISIVNRIGPWVRDLVHSLAFKCNYILAYVHYILLRCRPYAALYFFFKCQSPLSSLFGFSSFSKSLGIRLVAGQALDPVYISSAGILHNASITYLRWLSIQGAAFSIPSVASEGRFRWVSEYLSQLSNIRRCRRGVFEGHIFQLDFRRKLLSVSTQIQSNYDLTPDRRTFYLDFSRVTLTRQSAVFSNPHHLFSAVSSHSPRGLLPRESTEFIQREGSSSSGSTRSNSPTASIIVKPYVSGLSILRSVDLYPFLLAYESIFPVVDEFVLLVDSCVPPPAIDESQDRNYMLNKLHQTAARYSVNLRIVDFYDFGSYACATMYPRAQWITDAINVGLCHCSHDNIVFVMADEVYHEEIYDTILSFPSQGVFTAIAPSFLHFVGSMHHVRSPKTAVYSHATRIFKRDLYSSCWDGFDFVRSSPLARTNLMTASHRIFHIGYVLNPLIKANYNYSPTTGIFDPSESDSTATLDPKLLVEYKSDYPMLIKHLV